MHIKLNKIIPFTGIGAGVFIILCEVFTLLYTGRIFGYFAQGGKNILYNLPTAPVKDCSVLGDNEGLSSLTCIVA